MKITKRQLKQIIRQERENLIKENYGENRKKWAHPKTGENLYLTIMDSIQILLDQGVDTLELANELHEMADDVEASGPMYANIKPTMNN